MVVLYLSIIADIKPSTHFKTSSGKTSLLKTLIGRISKKTPKLSLTGEVRLNGSVVDPSDIKFRREIAYVEQDVSIPATATAREAITFSARLRLPKSMTDKEIADIVDDILDSLGLTECADRMIGGGLLMKGGLSGGEKVRYMSSRQIPISSRSVMGLTYVVTETRPVRCGAGHQPRDRGFGRAYIRSV